MSIAEQVLSKINLEVNEDFHKEFYIKNLNDNDLEIVYKLHKSVYPNRKDKKTKQSCSFMTSKYFL